MEIKRDLRINSIYATSQQDNSVTPVVFLRIGKAGETQLNEVQAAYEVSGITIIRQQ